MYPLSLGERCHNAVVYPFLNFVDHKRVSVYGGSGNIKTITNAPYDKIASFLSRQDKDIVMPSRRQCLSNVGRDTNTESVINTIMHIPADMFEYIFSQETHGLSVFIGILTNDTNINHDDDVIIKGVSVLTPRIMISFEKTKTADAPTTSMSIYVCDHIAWAKYIVSERESLELLETTEYVQKSREITGEQTLYRYQEIPSFVIPFTTVYTYTFSGIIQSQANTSPIGTGITLIKVSSVNFALFYSFVNECLRDFRYCIFNELTQLQSLVNGGIYHIYMLLLNQVRVLAVYVFESSWLNVIRPAPENEIRPKTKTETKSKKTRGNRISQLHDHITQTSTALIKYLPPVVRPTYDAFGRRIKHTMNNEHVLTGSGNEMGSGSDILLLKSSIYHKTLCDEYMFVQGFNATVTTLTSSISSSSDTLVCIDTIAHNYKIIETLTSSCTVISQEKWYYILYNAIIRQETLCKDILII
jgi:hypothetical protein